MRETSISGRSAGLSLMELLALIAFVGILAAAAPSALDLIGV